MPTRLHPEMRFDPKAEERETYHLACAKRCENHTEYQIDPETMQDTATTNSCADH